jgi:tyrosyl-tRNA synthetase
MPLLEGLDGKEKMSKSLGNYVGIAEPPQEIFGKLMSISDELMWRYIDLLSFESPSTVRKWKDEVAAGRNPRDIKVLFAKEIVTRFHGKQASDAAQEAFERRHRHGELPEDLQEVTLSANEDGLTIAQVLKQAGLAVSTSEAQRLVEQGGVKVDGERMTDRGLRFSRGARFVLQAGKRKAARIAIK